MRAITILTKSPSTNQTVQVTGTVVPTESPCKSNVFQAFPAYASVTRIDLITLSGKVPMRCDMYTDAQIHQLENELLEAAAEMQEEI